ncbi:hypothetical protein Emag_000911 [Eimeria magna]
MKSGEPCWLVVCTLRDVHREMVYDRAMRQIFPHHDLRRFVEVPPRLCPRNMDMEYSYAVAPYRVESNAQVAEDYARPLAPSVASSVLSEEIRERGGLVEEPPPLSPVISSASTPSTSVGGSAPGGSTPRQAPGGPEPPQRRRRLDPVSALFPATPELVDEVQSPPAPARGDSAGAGAESSADASHFTSH